ncbi:hypothetical protein BCR33DRAFT_578279 [Rhizoclosmatium globosum]|uniref:Uncharacterized protein n=1 Tax=Rhizoclosmatium globosum TaxID=329046 RepID=A0A1Y2B3E7_9FUNG|nr:hypothetical protein BCR33DRAFT_578279 [Rhizoclosmatium globosum]|eukprot:ORY29246.1 hypothetical protein BCR33DRAFT_578279 [Rhizoclosmatium globosum]
MRIKLKPRRGLTVLLTAAALVFMLSWLGWLRWLTRREVKVDGVDHSQEPGLESVLEDSKGSKGANDRLARALVSNSDWEPRHLVDLRAKDKVDYGECGAWNSLAFFSDAGPILHCAALDSLASKLVLDPQSSYLDKIRKVRTATNNLRHSNNPRMWNFIDRETPRPLVVNNPELLTEITKQKQYRLLEDRNPTRMESDALLKWSNMTTPIILRPSDSNASNTASSIQCGIIDKDIPQRYCDVQNIALKLDTLPVIPSSHKGQDLPLAFGGLEALCHLDENSWFGRGFGGGAAGWMFGTS